jgi:fumarate reductase subunit D
MGRSHKPVVWGLFAGGGTLSAFVFPAIVFVVGLGVPLGFYGADAFSYARMTALVANPLGALCVFGVLFLIMWHAAHRLRITAHDFGIRADGLVSLLCYGGAALGTIGLVYALFIA